MTFSGKSAKIIVLVLEGDEMLDNVMWVCIIFLFVVMPAIFLLLFIVRRIQDSKDEPSAKKDLAILGLIVGAVVYVLLAYFVPGVANAISLILLVVMAIMSIWFLIGYVRGGDSNCDKASYGSSFVVSIMLIAAIVFFFWLTFETIAAIKN